MIAQVGDSRLMQVWEQTVNMPSAQRALFLYSSLVQGSLDARDVSVGERDRQLLLVRKDLFGDPVEAITECPCCSAKVEMRFCVTDLTTHSPSNSQPTPLIANGYEIVWRLPSSRDVAELACETVPERLRQRLLERCLIEVRHENRNIPSSECPHELIDEVTQAMAQCDPFGDLSLDMNCPECNTAWNALFDIGAFLWREIDVWARRLMVDVHRLAIAYGWSERDILSMSPVRRAHYLELTQS